MYMFKHNIIYKLKYWSIAPCYSHSTFFHGQQSLFIYLLIIIIINLLFRRRISISILVQVEMNTLKALCLTPNKVKHITQDEVQRNKELK